jgi:hypothetical protein
MADCPNCGKGVPDGERLCPSCGFDTGEAQAGEVRALREADQIHPGRIGADDAAEFASGDEERSESPPAEERAKTPPREIEGGL